MNLAGLPAQTSLAGMSFVTMEPAPTIAFSPTVTGLQIIVLHPIYAFFFNIILPREYEFVSGSIKWVSNIHPTVTLTPSSIIMSSGKFVSKITLSPIKVFFGLIIFTPPPVYKLAV